MELLTRAAAGLVLLMVCSQALAQTSLPLSELAVTGLATGRGLGFLSHPDPAAGPLVELPGSGAPAESQAGFFLKHAEFTLAGRLFEHWALTAGAAVSGDHARFQEGYLAYTASPEWQARAGYGRVPFGRDPQTSTATMATVERPLLYGFGNFGWAGGLGFALVGERDYGVRVDYQSRAAFGSFSPAVSAGLFTGNGYAVTDHPISQAMLRISAASCIDAGLIQNELEVGASGSWGWNRLEANRTGRYLGVGTEGDLALQPEAGLVPMDLGERGRVVVLGLDLAGRMNDFRFQMEWARRVVHEGLTSEGYYLTGIYNLAGWGLPAGLELVGRWEQAAASYADGVHHPGRYYQAATFGANWNASRFWRLQLQTLTLWIDGRPHQFHGSDLLILQAQFIF